MLLILLMSERMGTLIATLRSEFDYIVIDTPPLLPVIDALVLTSLADRILVTVEWSQTPRENISEAFKILRPEVESYRRRHSQQGRFRSSPLMVIEAATSMVPLPGNPAADEARVRRW